MTIKEVSTDSKQESVVRLLQTAFNKPYIDLVATGMAALEVAMHTLNIKPGDKVLLPSESCYTIGASILRLGATPVFVDVDNSLTLSDIDLQFVNSQDIKAIIAIHAYGLPCDIRSIRKNFKDLPIIEDASLAFGIIQSDQKIGEYSDIVISSLGQNKPLDIRDGGIIASQDKNISSILNRRSSNSRLGLEPPLPYAASLYLYDTLFDRINIFQSDLKQRRIVAHFINSKLSELGYQTYHVPTGSDPCWHRIPFWVRDEKQAASILEIKEDNIILQEVHEISTPDLPMFIGRHHRLSYSGDVTNKKMLLLKTSDMIHAKNWVNNIGINHHAY